MLALPFFTAGLLFGGGYLAQFVRNYNQWKAAGGTPGDGSSPATPVLSLSACCEAVFSKSGIIGMGICLLLLVLLIVMVMRMGYSDVGEYDAERNLTYSNKGTYGTAGFMEKAEMKGVLDLVSDIRKHSGVILGKLDGQVVCIPENTRLNGNIAVFGASGSMKTRAYCINRILQSASEAHHGHMESLIITDPKSELYEKTSEYLRSKGYVVKVFNLIQPENSDSWNCLAEIEGDELMAQIFCDIIIKNTGSEKGDHFWNAAEMNLLKALVLYVALGYPPESKNIGEVYSLLILNAEKDLDNLFSMLPPGHPARAPYALFSQSSDTVRSGVIIGLGSRLQVFQNRPICQITSHDEIDLELPGKQPCAYFCITSDQDSTFDFLTSLFLSFAFIKLIRYADKNCADRRLPVPVHVLGEELTACGVIPDLSRKISVIRSRGVSMSCVFQNLAGLQNRYPYNQWQEILGCCDYQLALGCTDELTAKFLSDRTGEVSVHVFGVETSILARDLSWDWIGDAHDRYSVGDQVLVRVLEVDRVDPEHIKIRADIKSVSGGSRNDNLQKCRIQGKYAGTVTHVHKGIVYIRLSNGANAIAHTGNAEYAVADSGDHFCISRPDVIDGEREELPY